jgi:hypothetical protein
MPDEIIDITKAEWEEYRIRLFYQLKLIEEDQKKALESHAAHYAELERLRSLINDIEKVDIRLQKLEHIQGKILGVGIAIMAITTVTGGIIGYLMNWIFTALKLIK